MERIAYGNSPIRRYAPAMSDSHATVGIIANPMSGRDVRRLAARASTTTPEIKRDQVARAAVGAVAAGARRLIVMREPFQIATGAVEHLGLDAEIEILDMGHEMTGNTTERAAVAMREAGAGALIVLGGDGTNRCVARAWPDVPLMPLSTGTNNVFPVQLEATVGGVAAGLVAAGHADLARVAPHAKVVRVEIDGEDDDLALIDAMLLEGDSTGNLMPYDPSRMRELVLSRAEPASVGNSPIGGMLCPCRADDEFGVLVECVGHGEGGRPLLAPITPGIFKPVHVRSFRELSLGEPVKVERPGVLAFDGDRERTLSPGQSATLRVARNGPRVIDADAALLAAAEAGVFLDRHHFHDARNEAGNLGCC
jgi:hypothetical protein